MDVNRGDWAARAEERLLEAALRLAPGRTWGRALFDVAAREAELSAGEVELLAPRGPADLAALLWRRHDAQTREALAETDPAALKVRDRIRRGVETRVEVAAADLEVVRSASAWLALPHHAPLALRLAWASADAIWRWAGDTATDENHYSKRAILSGVLLSTATVRLSSGRQAAARHLDARLADVMAFETWKAKLPSAGGLAERLAGTLGRLRYGAR